MLLYLHVPFCRKRCDYCAFYSTVFEMDAHTRFERAIIAEIAHYGRAFDRPKIQTVYLGGGTPSILPVWSLERIVAAIDEHFRLSDNLEFSMESNPDSLDASNLAAFRDFGVNRLSIGMQSLNDDELAALGRPHTADQAVAAYAAARRAGFVNVNLDLIWGLPGQRLGSWRKQLRFITKELAPSHLSCYNLTLEPGTPLADKARAGQIELPADNEQARIFMHGAEMLEGRGYLHYEISNFAKMGFSCRHNLGYWEGADYLGLGPSAVSTVAGARFENPRDLAAWAEIAGTDTARAQAESLDTATRARELVMLSLRTAKGLSRKNYKELTGKNFVQEHREVLTALRQHELVRITRDYVRLTRNGMLVSNAIMERFFD